MQLHDSLTLKTEIDSKIAKEGPFELLSVSGTEKMSVPFAYKLQLYSNKKDILTEELVNSNATITIKLHDHEKPRFLNGKLTDIVRYRDGRYEATLIPDIQYSLNKYSRRLFQNKTPYEIIETILKENGGKYDLKNVRSSLLKDKKMMPFCAQYDESDFAFLSRLLEYFGIFYYFTHTDTGHTLVLADSVASYVAHPVPLQALREKDGTAFISAWAVHSSAFGPGKISVQDFNPEIPATKLTDTITSTTKAKEQTKYEMSYFGAGYSGAALAELKKVRMEEYDVKSHIAIGQTNSLLVTIGNTYTLKDDFEKEAVKNYLVTEVTFIAYDAARAARHADIVGVHAADASMVQFKAIPADKTFRPERVTATPVISGVHRAEVLADSDVLDTDKEEKNRIRVKLMWEAEDSDEKNTCYIWGNPFGVVRKGTKVTVCFPDGNPYQIPILNNIIADGDTNTANDNKYQTVFMAPEGNTANSGKHNMMVLDDTEGDTKTMKFLAPGHKEVIVEQGNDKTLVKTGDYEISIEKGQVMIRAPKGLITLEGDEILLKATKDITLQAGGDLIQSAMNMDTTAKANINVEGMSIANTAKAAYAIKGASVAAEAAAAMTVKGGAATVVEGGAAVTIKGPIINMS